MGNQTESICPKWGNRDQKSEKVFYKKLTLPVISYRLEAGKPSEVLEVPIGIYSGVDVVACLNG